MAGATAELDFFGIQKENAPRSQFQKLIDHGRTIRGIQNSMSKINPDILKTIIGSGIAKSPEKDTLTAPLTIFYNGTVSIFELSRDKAEMLMKLAAEGNTKFSVESASIDQHKLIEKLKADLPIARKKSLQMFLEKRKERLISSSPYAGGGSESVVERKLE